MSASIPSVRALIPTKPPAVSTNRAEPPPVTILAKPITNDPDAAAAGSHLDTTESTPRPRSPTRLSDPGLTATVSHHGGVPAPAHSDYRQHPSQPELPRR